MMKHSLQNILFELLNGTSPYRRSKKLLLITLHAFAWSVFLFFPLLFFPVKFTSNILFFSELLGKLFFIIIFYLHYYYLLPVFFEKKKTGRYFLFLLLLFIAAAVQDIVIRNTAWKREMKTHRFSSVFPGDTIISSRPSQNFISFSKNDTARSEMVFMPPMLARNGEKTLWGLPVRELFFSAWRTASILFILLLLGGLIRLAVHYLKNKEEKKALENETLNAEINLLKSQINPHFLFNTLNGIYSLAQERSAKAAVAVLKLSELLRYMLYESAQEKTPLTKEIEYITNYIELQRLRLSSRITIDYRISGNMNGYSIAPLLLIPFIENAFKHGISYSQTSVITIHLSFFEETLTLHMQNPVVEDNSFASGGLGLKNVRRRLQLIYPASHLLDIIVSENIYTVNLKLSL